jgi:hypothetical protein
MIAHLMILIMSSFQPLYSSSSSTSADLHIDVWSVVSYFLMACPPLT